MDVNALSLTILHVSHYYLASLCFYTFFFFILQIFLFTCHTATYIPVKEGEIPVLITDV